MKTFDLGNDLRLEIKNDNIMFISNGRIYGQITKDPLKVGKKYDGVNNQLPLKYRPTKDSWINWDKLYNKVTEKSYQELRDEAFKRNMVEIVEEKPKEPSSFEMWLPLIAVGVGLIIMMLL